MTLHLLEERFAVYRLPPADTVPAPVGSFFSVTRTAHELSVVCEESRAPRGANVESGWRCLAVAGPLAFSEIGVLAALAKPLAAAGVSIFVVSTFDTDYLLVKDADLARARGALEEAGHALAVREEQR